MFGPCARPAQGTIGGLAIICHSLPGGSAAIGSLDICEQLIGTPDKDFISTSYVERQNLTMRMSMRRFTRLTNAFSKKLENLKAAVALHFAHYNFVRIHKTLRVTPAMAAGVTDRLWSMHELLDELHAQALILAP
jgi:hypothetical protein